MKPTPEQIKQMADRAEARSKGLNGSDEAKDFIATAMTEAMIDAEIERLAKLPIGVYESERVEAAKKLKYRAAYLDQVVAAKRPKKDDAENHPPHWLVVPWDGDVATGELLDAIVAVFDRHVVLPKHASEAMALWCLHAWAFDAWDVSPFLMLTSPTKHCGKTTLLILLSWLTPKSVVAGNLSASSIFRYVEEQRPTLLIDEADTFLKSSDEIRGILNAGHTKVAAHAIRNVEMGGQHVPKMFSTWAPKIVAGIGRFAGTLEDRSVIIQMQRKPRGAQVERCRHRDTTQRRELRQKALRWSGDNGLKLNGAEPKLPGSLNDRAADNWEPLLAIADLAGEEWGKKARTAARALSGADDDDDDIGVDLLGDFRKAFAAAANVDMFTREVLEHLVKDTERPWSTYGRGDKPITDRQIARLLAPFKIISTTIHRDLGTHAKGYRFADFEEAWNRYCPGQNAPFPPGGHFQACERASVDLTNTSGTFGTVRKGNSHGNEKYELSANDAGLHVRTDKNGQTGEACVSATKDDLEGAPAQGLGNDCRTESCQQCGDRDERPLPDREPDARPPLDLAIEER